MKIGNIQLSDWCIFPSYCNRMGDDRFSHIMVFRSEYNDCKWFGAFYGDLTFCNTYMFDNTFETAEQAMQEMDRFLIRIEKMIAFQ